MTHVVIRCDATAAGGIGHLVRAVSVADAAREAGYSVTLAGSIESPLALGIVESAGLEVTAAHEDLTVLAAEQGATVVHVDDYSVGADARKQVQACGAILSSMEDGTYGRRAADVVVDSTIRAEYGSRPADGSGIVLRGISYAPMRAEVREARARRAAMDLSGAEAHVLIVMGGTDATGAAATVASVCTRARGADRITVISPRENWGAISASGEDIELLEPSPAFLDLASRATLVVSASGTTAWELACITVPSLLVAVVDNQKAGYDAALAEGVARGLGTLESVRANPAAATHAVEVALRDIREGRSWSRQSSTVIDGLGAQRIIEAWGKALTLGTRGGRTVLAARLATLDDSALLLRWRNDPVTRQVSRAQEPVRWANHQEWYSRVLADDSRHLYVIERGSDPVGTVRFDQHEGNEWEVSITLAPEWRGQRLGVPVLEAGEQVFLAQHPHSRIIAAILPDNAPSQRLFARAGYILDPDRDDGDFEVLVKRGPSSAGSRA